MKKILLFAALLTTLSCSSKENENITSMDDIVTHALISAEQQSLLMAQKYAGKRGILPRSFVDGKETTSDSRWWCSGFFPGVLWYLYEANGNAQLLEYARTYTARVEREKYTIDNHDIGFILNCSFGNGYRITGDASYKEVLLTGSHSLSTRFNPKVGLIRSWDFNKERWQYPVIIDNMMNLELLLWASSNGGGNNLREMAMSHADKTMLYHYRPDMSCYHVVSYDTITGKPHIRQTHQGYSDESAWARGQAWGLYGYTVMYRETKDEKYLDMAKKIAKFIIHHKNMPEDGILYWDFDAPDIPKPSRDASAAAVMASALMELFEYVDDDLKREYLGIAEKQIRTLASPEYTAGIGENGNFILKHSVGSYPHHSEVDVPLTYADYYYIEALMRYKKLIRK